MMRKTLDKLARFAAGTAFIGLMAGSEYIAEKIAEHGSNAAVFIGIAAIAGTLAFVHTDC